MFVELAIERHSADGRRGSLPFSFDTLFKEENPNLGQYMIDTVDISYVCILTFLFQLNDCMRDVVYLRGNK